MKKIVFLSSFILVLGCVSFHRGPASVETSSLQFNLFGQNPLTSENYSYELLNLKALPDKVEFQQFQFSDTQTERIVSEWQDQLKETRHQFKDGFHFEKNNVVIDVDGSDMKLLGKVLKALDQTENDPNLRNRKKLEAISAFNERFKDSFHLQLEILLAPFTLLERIGTPNITVAEAPAERVFPSSFWSPHPQSSMWMGNGTIDFEKINNEICTYQGPKKGFGVHAGFKVKCLGKKLKAKFGNEVYSGPLNSRIYDRLGYNVPAIHFVRELKVAYDRHIFSEINSRKTKYFRVRLAGAPVYNYKHNVIYDPFNLVKFAQMKNGQKLSPAEFKRELLRTCDQNSCEFTDANVNASFENEISYVAFEPSTVTENIGDEVGPWNYSGLDHTQRPEVRALLLLGAWTGNFDLRKDNTRLVYDSDTGEMKHFISDVGSGLGNAHSLFKTGSRIADMSWKATLETQIQDSDLPATKVVNLSGIQELEANEAFRKVTFQDAQWMIRQIASISEQELSEALAASGLSAAEFLLAREKMISIRQKMIEHFKLKSEFASQFRPIQTHMNFDPDRDHVDVKLASGRIVRLENRGIRLVNGTLIEPANSKSAESSPR